MMSLNQLFMLLKPKWEDELIKSSPGFKMLKLRILFFVPWLLTVPVIAFTKNTIFLLDLHQAKAPKITLHGYMLEDSTKTSVPDPQFQYMNKFSNEFIDKNGSDWVVSGEVLKLVFVCDASFPISWSFPYPSHFKNLPPFLPDSDEIRYSSYNDDSKEAYTTGFQIAIFIDLKQVNFFSQNITCEYVSKQAKTSSSIHVFMRDKDPIEGMGSNITVYFNSSLTHDFNSRLVIPCRPASPNITIIMEHEMDRYIHTDTEHIEDTVWSSNLIDLMLDFDPKIGFTFRSNRMVYVNNTYRCYAENADISRSNDDSDFVYITIVDKSAENLQWESYVGKSAKVQANPVQSVPNDMFCDNEWIITCCSGNDAVLPKLYSKRCDSPLSCQLLKTFVEQRLSQNQSLAGFMRKGQSHEIISKDCTLEGLFGAGQLIVCLSDNVHYLQQYVDTLHPNISGPVLDRSKRITWPEPLLVNVTRRKIDKIWQDLPPCTPLSGYTEMETTRRDKQVWISVAKPIHRSEIFDKQEYISYSSSIVVQSQSYLSSWSSLNSRRSFNRRRQHHFYLEYNRDEVYEGEPLVFVCIGLKMYFADGPHLVLNWEGRNTTWLSVAQNKSDEINSLFLSENSHLAHEMKNRIVILKGSVVIASKNLKSVDCWMPVLSSYEWIKVTKNINVLPAPSAPEFVEPANETVYIELGKPFTITCTIKNVLVMTDLELFLNGKRQHIRYLRSNQTETVTENTIKVFKKVDIKSNLMKVVVTIGAFQDENLGFKGLFTCDARNVNATSIRTVHVHVHEANNDVNMATVYIILSSAVILILIMAAILGKRFYNKQTGVRPEYCIQFPSFWRRQ